MKIALYDEDGRLLAVLTSEASDHWEACKEGHTILAEGRYEGAEDFDVIEEELEQDYLIAC